MKAQTFFIPALSLSALVAVLLAPMSSQGEPAAVVADDPAVAAVAAVLAEVAAQQVAIIDNQIKIDAKLAGISENIRVARIFVSRGGGKTK